MLDAAQASKSPVDMRAYATRVKELLDKQQGFIASLQGSLPRFPASVK